MFRVKALCKFHRRSGWIGYRFIGWTHQKARKGSYEWNNRCSKDYINYGHMLIQSVIFPWPVTSPMYCCLSKLSLDQDRGNFADNNFKSDNYSNNDTDWERSFQKVITKLTLACRTLSIYMAYALCLKTRDFQCTYRMTGQIYVSTSDRMWNTKTGYMS